MSACCKGFDFAVSMNIFSKLVKKVVWFVTPLNTFLVCSFSEDQSLLFNGTVLFTVYFCLLCGT